VQGEMERLIEPRLRNSSSIGGYREALSPAAIAPGALVLACEQSQSIEDRVVAYVNGIPIGKSARQSSLTEGDSVVIACDYFPCVSLPCQVRFGLEDANRDIAPVFTIRSAGEVERLVGSGRLEDIKLKLQNGVLSGTATNKINGLSQPLLLCRVNGFLLRPVQTDKPRMRDEGGCRVSFAMPVEASDLTLSGTSYELLQLPDMAILGTLSFPSADALGLAPLISCLEYSVEHLRRRLDLELVRARDLAERRHKESQDVLEAVVEYLVALVFDRVASKQDDDAAVDESEALAEFRRLIAGASERRLSAHQHDSQHVRPDSLLFVDGWFEVEVDDRGLDFRWMGLGSSLFNPQPARPVTAVTFTVSTTATSTEPKVTATFDAEPVDVEVISSPNGAPYTLRLVPRGGAPARLAQVIRLSTTQIARPDAGTDSAERRVLTFAVLGATFHYQRN
jgi:hypothetical protein